MTVGTNALLEGRVARTALLATEGFTDLEELGPPGARGAVPALRRPPAAARAGRAARAGAGARPGRTACCGRSTRTRCARRSRASTWRRRRSACCGASATPSTSGAWPSWSRRRCRGVHVSTSHETAGVFREYERCATTVVDAALSPLLRGYLERLTERAGDAGLPEPEVMLSSGGTASAATAARHASWTVLSGPGAAARGAARRAVGGASGATRVGLDMGGTSCDVSLIVGGAAAVGSGREVGGRALALPMVDVHTVGRRRRLDRLARRGRGAAGGAALGGRRPGPGLLRPRRRRADRDRRQPAARLPRRGRRRWPAACGSTAAAAERAVGALGGRARAGRRRGRGRHRARGERGDGAGGAGGDGRARHRPARPRAGALRRRRPAARRADRRRARDAPRARARSRRRAVGARPGGVRAPPRPRGERAARRATRSRARRIAEPWSGSAKRGREELRRAADAEPSCAPPTTSATRARRSSCRSRASSRRTRTSCGARSTAPTRSATATADPDAELELVTVRVAVALPGAEPRPAAWDGLPGGAADGPRRWSRCRGSTLVVPRRLARPRRATTSWCGTPG